MSKPLPIDWHPEIDALRAQLLAADFRIKELQFKLEIAHAIQDALAGMVAHKMRREPCP
jgi:hypothetical protein